MSLNSTTTHPVPNLLRPVPAPSQEHTSNLGKLFLGNPTMEWAGRIPDVGRMTCDR